MDSFNGNLQFSSSDNAQITEINVNDIESVNYYTNFSQDYISSDTGVDKVINSSSSNVWHLAVKSPSVIKENIFDRQDFNQFRVSNQIDYSAQVAVEIVFKSAKEIAKIRVNPNINDAIDLLQVVFESTISSQEVNYADFPINSNSNPSPKQAVLKNSIRIKNSIDVNLPVKAFVKSVILFFGQKSYTRTTVTPIQSEMNAKLVNKISSAIRSSRSGDHDTLQDVVIKYFLKNYEVNYINRNKKLYQYEYTNYYPSNYEKINVGAMSEVVDGRLFSDIDDMNKFKNTTILSNIVFSIISFSIGSKLRSIVNKTYIESNLRESVKQVSRYASGGTVPVYDSNKFENNLHFTEESIDHVSALKGSELFSNVENSGAYEYIFSIKNISFYSSPGSDNYRATVFQDRSVFASKKIPINGLPMKVKMMSDYFSEIQYEESAAIDSTSIEFSVSIKDNPIFEEDWTPIMPYNDTSIRTEVLYPDSFGLCTLRFLPQQESVRLFQNRNENKFGSYSVDGKTVKINEFDQYSKYFVSYSLFDDTASKEPLLFSKSMANPVLMSSNSSGSTGEKFTKTSMNNAVQLHNMPYVSSEKLVNAVYSSINGTITTGKSSFNNFDYSNYSPVRVMFSDGSTAINLTNYIRDSFETPVFYSQESIMFIHSDNNIIFNQPIDKPFTVIYQYIPGIFRYRVILRNLSGGSSNYSVDRLLFKFSVDANSQLDSNFTKYDNKYKKKII